MNTPLPPLIQQHAVNAQKRVSAFDPQGDSFRVFFLTDVHSSGNDNVRQYDFLREIAPAFHPNLFINGGDIGLDTGESKEEMEALLGAHQAKMASFDAPFVLLKGNHDYGSQSLPNDVLNHRFNDRFVQLAGDKVDWVFRPNGGQYGVYHDPSTNVYLFLLNTTDGDRRNYYVSWEQIRYLGEKLSALPQGARVLFVAHRDIDASGYWNCDVGQWEAPCYHFDSLKRLLGAFVSRRKFEEEGEYFDFSALPSDIACYGWLAGDSHFFQDQTSNGIRYIAREGYGGVDAADLPKGAHKTPYDFQSPHAEEELECDFDLLVFKKDGSAKLFHFGPDEEKGDLLLA